MNIKILVRSFKYVWSVGKNWVVYSLILSLILGVLPVALIWLTKELVNTIVAAMSDAKYFNIALLLLLIQFGLMVLDSLLRHLKDYIDQRISIEMEYKLSINIIQKLDKVPYSLFDMPDFYNQVERIQGNAGDRFLSPVKNIFVFLESLISIITLLLFLFSIHWSLGVISILALIPVLIVKSFYGNRQFWLNYYMAPVAREAGYTKRLLTERQFAKEVKVFNLSSYLKNRWSEKFLFNANKSLNLLKKSKKAEVGLDGLSAFFYAVAAGILIWLTKKSAVQIGEFVAIGQSIQATQSSIFQISSSIAGIYEDSLYIKDYYNFIDFESKDSQISEGNQDFPKNLTEGIKFDNVSFKYPGSEVESLSNVSFTIKPGEKIAIVGQNGSGKTTLIKCLLGLYSTTKGEIFFDDLSIKSIAPHSLKKNMTAIFQDFIRYSFSVKDNISFSDISQLRNEKKIVNAAKESGIHEDIIKLDSKYETNLGRFLKDGVDLSGGQWQKIALSRAVFKDSKIVILDEPTAALDPEAEIKLLKHFESISEGKTSFFISHRMALGRIVDRILVMKKGKLVEIGSHEELITREGEYAKLYNMQANFINNNAEEGGI